MCILMSVLDSHNESFEVQSKKKYLKKKIRYNYCIYNSYINTKSCSLIIPSPNIQLFEGLAKIFYVKI